MPSLKTLDFTFYIGSTPTFLYFDLYLNTAFAQNVRLCFLYRQYTNLFYILICIWTLPTQHTTFYTGCISYIQSRTPPQFSCMWFIHDIDVIVLIFCTARARPHLRYFDNDELCKVDTLMNRLISNENNKRSVLRRQCSDINQNIKRLVYCMSIFGIQNLTFRPKVLSSTSSERNVKSFFSFELGLTPRPNLNSTLLSICKTTEQKIEHAWAWLSKAKRWNENKTGWCAADIYGQRDVTFQAKAFLSYFLTSDEGWANVQNIRLCFLYRRYTNLFIFWFVFQHCLRRETFVYFICLCNTN